MQQDHRNAKEMIVLFGLASDGRPRICLQSEGEFAPISTSVRPIYHRLLLTLAGATELY